MSEESGFSQSESSGNSRFGHGPYVHLLGIVVPVVMGYLAYKSSVEHFVNGGIALRIGLVGFCVILGLGVVVLYLKSGLLRYEVTDACLVIRKPWSRVEVSWAEIRRIDWSMALHYVIIRGEGSRVVFFTSTDFFPRVVDFLHLIQVRSGCEVDERLERIIR